MWWSSKTIAPAAAIVATSARTAAESSAPTCPTAPQPPRSTADASRIAQTLLESASQKPPIASSSAASSPSRTGEEHGGQLTRYKRRTNDPLPTRDDGRTSAALGHRVSFVGLLLP